MQTYQIEKGIPIPPKQWGGSKWFDVMSSLDVGDSFTVEFESDRKSAMRSASDHGIKLTSRKTNGKGIRLWRIE